MAFRIDEFSKFPSGAGIDGQERTRFNTIGFGFTLDDIQGQITVPTQPTATDAIRQVLLALVELVDFPVSLVSSGFWTLNEIVGYLNERQAQFLKDTGIRLRRATLDGIANSEGMRIDEFARMADTDIDAADRTRFSCVGLTIPARDPIRNWALPSDWADTHRVTWRNPPIAPAVALMRIDEFAKTADSDIDAFDRARFSLVGFTFPFWYLGLFLRREVPRGDSWELDQADRDWQTASQTFPTLYTEVEEPPKTLEVAPGATDVLGIAEILYTSVGDELLNSDINFSVPDEFVHYIKWGVISDMLSKPGRAFDPERSVYAEQRYQEGVVAARLLIRGGN